MEWCTRSRGRQVAQLRLESRAPPETASNHWFALREGPKYRMVPMIPKDLLDILVCPACKRPLAPSENGASLKCNACRRVYPIRDNIPILLIDEAVVDPA